MCRKLPYGFIGYMHIVGTACFVHLEAFAQLAINE
jgi:hypothetical protein